jgi:hypothetical protein
MMRHLNISILLLAGAVVFLPLSTARAQSPKLEHQEHHLEPHPLAPDNFNGGFITLDQGLWEALSDKPQDEFENALDAFAAGKSHEMAGDIYSAAAVTRLAAGRALPEPKKRLVASLFELKDLAERAEKGKITDKDQIDQPFGRTLAALSQYYAARAEREWTRNKVGDAGKSLSQGVKDLEHAFTWAGYHPSADESTVVETARTTATRLATTKDYDKSQVNDALAAFAGLVRDYSDSIWQGVPDLTPPEAKTPAGKTKQS